MSFKQKIWKDRISEHPTRRTLTDVSNNTTKTVDVAREEGTISQEGDAYSAANMNDLEQRVADGFSTLSQDSVKIATKNTTSDSIAFGIDSKGNYGYIKEGADTVTPFKSQKDIDNAYNSGVAAADKRVNTSSASYNSGYTNGHNQGVTDKRNDFTGNRQYVSLNNPADSTQCQWDVQGKAGYSGVIFQLTGATYWVYHGDENGTNSSGFPVSYNSSTGVVHIGPFYRHTAVQGYIYYY